VARADAKSYPDVTNASVVVHSSKKFYVFHQRHLGKSANIDEYSSPAENAVIAASHSQ
jgi:hypothetical protein